MAGCVDTIGNGDATPELTQTPTPTPTDPQTPSNDTGTVDAAGNLTIHYIDVGQADAALIEFPNGDTMLIDSGHWQDNGETVINYLEAVNVTRIDYLVATHAHADHIGGHADVISHYETSKNGVGTAFDSNVPHDTQTYNRYLTAIEEYGVNLEIVSEDTEFTAGNTTINVLNPPTDSTTNDLHYNSVSVIIEYGDLGFLFTGDAEQDAEQRIADQHHDVLSNSDVYQAGHHGSYTSSNPAFLDAITVDVAVVSSAFDSQYGHPHNVTLERFNEYNITTYWTGIHGNVTADTDGDALTIDPESDVSTDPATIIQIKAGEKQLSQITQPIVDWGD